MESCIYLVVHDEVCDTTTMRERLSRYLYHRRYPNLLYAIWNRTIGKG